MVAGRRVVAGSGVAGPKSRCAGCEPAARATESLPGCPPGPSILVAAAVRRESAWRRAKMASLTRRLRVGAAAAVAVANLGDRGTVVQGYNVTRLLACELNGRRADAHP